MNSLRSVKFPAVVDCHAHVSPRDLAHGGFRLDQILVRCERYGVVGVVYSLYFEDGRLELPVDEIERIAAARSVAVGISFGVCPPTRAISPSLREQQQLGAMRVARQLASEGRIVAIGEVGLDYYWPLVEFLKSQGMRNDEEIRGRVVTNRDEILKEKPVQDCLETQAAIFRDWIRVAVETDLPLVIHGRDAYRDILEILECSEIAPERVILHCFGGTPEEALRAASRGIRISIPSSVGYRPNFASVARVVDLAAVVIETDSPYHSPFVGLWKAAGRRVQELPAPAGIKGAARQSWTAQKRRGLFAESVDERYPELEFSVFEGGATRVAPGAEHLSRSSARYENESTFVRCAATELAKLKGGDVETVCEATTANAFEVYSTLRR